MKQPVIAALAALTLVLSAGCAGENGGAERLPPATETAAPPAEAAAIVAAQLPSYPLESCPVSGEKLGSMGDPVDFVHDGRLVRFCCAGCDRKFLKDPAAYFATIDEAVVAAQLPSYPLDTCPVDGAKLGGQAVNHVDGTKLVRLCRGGCVDAYRRDPRAAMVAVDHAWIAAQLASYPTDECPVMEMGVDAMETPKSFLYGTRLVRLCCEACIEEFRKEPAKYLAKLDEM